MVNLCTRFGHEAVIGFFVLSGLSIAHSLSRSSNYREFLWRRMVRLYPPKVAAVGWAVIVFLGLKQMFPTIFSPTTETWNLAHDLNFLNPLTLLNTLLYMPSGYLVLQFWSLPHEMLFYVVAPLLCTKPRLTLIISSVSLGFYTLAGKNWPWTGLFSEFIFHYLFFFALGIELFQQRARLFTPAPWKTRGRLGLLLLASLIAMAVGAAIHSTAGEIGAVLVTIVAIQYLLKFPVNNRLLLALGAQSYSLYLTHFATIALTVCLWHDMSRRPMPETNPFVWPLFVVASLLFNAVFFQLFEQPSRNLLSRLRQKQKPELCLAHDISR